MLLMIAEAESDEWITAARPGRQQPCNSDRDHVPVRPQRGYDHGETGPGCSAVRHHSIHSVTVFTQQLLHVSAGTARVNSE